MSMKPETQEPSSSDGGNNSSNNIVSLTIVVATAQPESTVRLFRFDLPTHEYPSFCEKKLQKILEAMEVPKTFLNGHDCNMVENLSIMLCDSILVHSSVEENSKTVEKDCFSAFVKVFKTHCSYNVVNRACFFRPSSDMVERMACDGGNYSLPAGATILKKLTVQDEDEEGNNCAICLEKLMNSSSDGHAVMLPCSHVGHYGCILEWFVQKGTCPVCRFACTHAS